MAPDRASMFTLAALVAAPLVAQAAPVERRLYSDTVEASSFLWNDWNKYVENYHPNYVGDDDPTTGWVEGDAGSGAGEWLRVQLTPLEQTTRVRLRVRNGYQKSKPLFAANARAKDVVVRLLPSKVERKVTLTDQDGWQELTIEQPSGPVRAVELQVASVYEGTKYKDLVISDVQVFATSEIADNPSFEKAKRKTLMTWRAERLAAAKAYRANQDGLPMYGGYKVTSTERSEVCEVDCEIAGMIASAAADPDFKEWKEALAVAKSVAAELDSLPAAQVVPGRTKLPVPDGFDRPTLDNMAGFEGPWYQDATLRLPLIDSTAALFAGQLKVLDIKGKQTPTQFAAAADRRCKGEVAWVKRASSREKTGPSTVQALVIGRCGKIEGRDGFYPAAALQLLVYHPDGRLALVVSDGAIDAYRWSVDGERPVVTGGHALLMQGVELDATKIGP